MIRVSELNKSYGAKNKVLRDVSFELPDTGFICIVGPSGCGKTTLLNALGGLDTFDDGTIRTDKVKHFHCGGIRSEGYRNQNYGYIFQNYYLLAEHSAAYNVYLGLHAMALSHKEKLKRVRESLAAVDMGRFARRMVDELSGGQQQRVAIARALARRPRVIFADEPTGNLDQANTVNICTLLRKISRESLVVMVTHEESIARFFADRIITIEDGRLVKDETDWTRDGLSVDGNTFYAGDYAESNHKEEGVSLRLLRQEGAAEVKITVLALKDRVVIKLDDGRTISCTKSGETPVIEEGCRPVLRLETIEHTDEAQMEKPKQRGRAGRGLRLGMLAKEARHLAKGKGAKRVGTRFFLVVLTLLTLLTFADYQYVGYVDPEDFVTTHSQILEVRLSRGEKMGAEILKVAELTGAYMTFAEESELDLMFLPYVSLAAESRIELFKQFGSVKEKLTNFNYIPLEYLDETTLIHGRMAETAEEIVVDRWVLDAMINRDGIVQSGVNDCSYFIGKKISYNKKAYSPTIVGICDSGEPAVYMDMAGIASIAEAGTEVIGLSDFQKLCPVEAAGITLGNDDCIVLTNNAGMSYGDRIGSIYYTNDKQEYRIKDALEANTYAKIVISDQAMKERMYNLVTDRFYILSQDKAALKEYLETDANRTLKDMLKVEILDDYTDAWEEKVGQTQLRLDARTIVTVTILILCLVMLYLFQRSRVQERIGMVAVYRLLGIPGRKLATIFCMESFLIFLRTTLPAAVFVWGVLGVLSLIRAIEVPLYLTWKAAAIGGGGILLLHMLVSVLPLYRLLRLPPARLAAKFDF